MIWKKLTIETSTEAVDLISEFLNEHGAEGVLIEDHVPLSEEELSAMFVDIPLMDVPDDGSAKVSCFLPDGQTAEKIKAEAAKELFRLSQFLSVGSGNITIEDTDDDAGWQDNWKKYFQPIRHDGYLIVPEWEEVPDKQEEETLIRISSVMSFGTGSHETTRLCLSALKKYLQPGESVFDVGSGSGILSIAAALTGAGFVHGLDIDPQAEISAAENAEVNGLSSDRILFSTGNLLHDNPIVKNAHKSGEDGTSGICDPEVSSVSGPAGTGGLNDAYQSTAGSDPVEQREYDLVLSNILADVIIPLAGVIGPYLRKGGIWITSGILDVKEDETKEAILNNGFSIEAVEHLGEWVSIIARKE